MKTRAKQISRAVTLAIAGSGLLAGATAVQGAVVYYNQFNAGEVPNYQAETDGWIRGAGFTGLGFGQTPFGFTGKMLNWAVHSTGPNETIEVSRADALATYGVAADIDTAKGAWNDRKPCSGVGIGPCNQGWAHNTDYGLFKSDITQRVTLTVSSVNPSNWNTFGLSLFEGMDSGSTYFHHASWNNDYHPGQDDSGVRLDNPFGTVGLTFLDYSDHNTLTFTAQAGQIYSILLGGYSGSGFISPVDGYKVDITTSAVPLPAAAWLFGSGLMGLAGLRRKQRPVA